MITKQFVTRNPDGTLMGEALPHCLCCPDAAGMLSHKVNKRLSQVHSHLSLSSDEASPIARNQVSSDDLANKAAKLAAKQAVDAKCKELDAVAQEIHANPELNYVETLAHDNLTKFLTQQGFQVESSYLGVDTAFRATLPGPQRSGPTAVVCLEYDALPGIGHACGHNLISEAGLAAGIGIKAAIESCPDILSGNVVLLGTPAEEGGGGKIELAERGAFNGVDLAMMVHGAPMTVAYCNALAIESVRVRYYGQNAHAAAFPYDGVNALDAVIAAFNSISAMRQQFKSTWRVHGIIFKGGDKPNIIPDYSEAHFYIRAPTDAELSQLRKKVMGCFEGAAISTGCTVKIDKLIECDDEELSKLFWPKYSNLITNPTIVESYKTNATSSVLGLNKTFQSRDEEEKMLVGSTDMGNVSYLCPSIHPLFAIPSNPGEGNHHPGFTACAGTPAAMQEARDAGLAMACTLVDMFADHKLVDIAKQEFKEQLKVNAALEAQ